MSSDLSTKLVPWDPDSISHRKCLVRQRDECGWHQEKPDKDWREQQLKGTKAIYWIAFPINDSPELERVRTLLQTSEAHVTLQDSARSIHAACRQAAQEAFLPVGHISLDSENPEAAKITLDLPSTGVFWIKTFYVSQLLQGKGIGRAAMDEIEEMAVREPINAKTLVIDTVQEDDQVREDFAQAAKIKVPKVANQSWYSRRGYRLFKTVQNYYHITDLAGKTWDTRTVFMRKDIC